MHRIEAELLIPGRGHPVRGGVVILDGPRISYAGPAAMAPEAPGAPVSRAATVMPGMWDCHGHFLGTRSFDLGRLPLDPEPQRAARCARDLRASAQRTDMELRAIVEVAALADRVVAAHCHGKPGIMAALRQARARVVKGAAR